MRHAISYFVDFFRVLTLLQAIAFYCSPSNNKRSPILRKELPEIATMIMGLNFLIRLMTSYSCYAMIECRKQALL